MYASDIHVRACRSDLIFVDAIVRCTKVLSCFLFLLFLLHSLILHSRADPWLLPSEMIGEKSGRSCDEIIVSPQQCAYQTLQNWYGELLYTRSFKWIFLSAVQSADTLGPVKDELRGERIVSSSRIKHPSATESVSCQFRDAFDVEYILHMQSRAFFFSFLFSSLLFVRNESIVADSVVS